MITAYSIDQLTFLVGWLSLRGWRLLGAVLHSSGELDELLRWLCQEDSTVYTVWGISITVIVDINWRRDKVDLSSTAHWSQVSCSCAQDVTWPAFTVPRWRLSALDQHQCVSETGVFPSLDHVSGTLCLSHYVTEISHLYSLRDFWRHFGLCRAVAHSDCCLFAPCTNILTYLSNWLIQCL